MTEYTMTYTNMFDVETERTYTCEAKNASEAIAELYAEQTVANLVKIVNNFTGQIDDNA